MNFIKYLPERMLCKNEKYVIGYKKGLLIVRDSKTKAIIRKRRIHPFYESMLLIERLLRIGPRAAVFLSIEKMIYSDHGLIYRYDILDDKINVEHKFSKGMNNPLQFCKTLFQEGEDCEILYGEYIWNTDKGPVSIWRRNEKEKWEEIYQFPPNTITHIHNIIYDKYREKYIILTGDEDSESAIWQASRDFSQVDRLVGGEQKYRACVAFPTRAGLIYATDTPLESNRLMYLNTKSETEKIQDIPGPVIYGTVKENYLYFATSVEGNPKLGGWRYRLSNKLGPGIKDRRVHVFRCNQEGKLEEILSFKKDNYPMWLFQFGNGLFPDNDEDSVYICPQSCCEKGTYRVNE